MATIRHRPGRGTWLVDYYTPYGVRRRLTCRTREQAEARLEHICRELRRYRNTPGSPGHDPEYTVAGYAQRWLELAGVTLKPSSLRGYETDLRVHILPALRRVRLQDLDRALLKSFLADRLRSGCSAAVVRHLHSTLSAMLGSAVDDGLLPTNPAQGLKRRLRIGAGGSRRSDLVKAMDAGQLERFLEVAARCTRHHPMFLLMARTGLRVGEACALQWGDVDLTEGRIRVERAAYMGQISTPKGARGRDVDLREDLPEVLRRLRLQRQEEALASGAGRPPAWVFAARDGEMLDAGSIRRAFKRVLREAGLPGHFTPHSLRHSFASLALQAGESPVYVQQQLGHASYQLTVDTYGRWFRAIGRPTEAHSSSGSSL